MPSTQGGGAEGTTPAACPIIGPVAPSGHDNGDSEAGGEGQPCRDQPRRRARRRLPGFGIVQHRGRRSGRPYRTPINVFRVSGGYVAALTYGTDTDWVKNVLAAGGCELEVRRRRVRLTDPRVVHDETRHDMPLGVRRLLAVLGVTDFLYLAVAPPLPARS
ncbi:MAG TPA: nitroreductase family deazaflavin-dependent oxidoreductase [Jiangellaceae bacterium]|nr:nitroreductase family deazaflavin-dependent oxidoreductase [Jiangellaceae bacterium]